MLSYSPRPRGSEGLGDRSARPPAAGRLWTAAVHPTRALGGETCPRSRAGLGVLHSQACVEGSPHEGNAGPGTWRLLPQVDPKPFYEACVHDSCSCDTGGDCECFCSAVAAYAQECTKEGACVFWRTPDLCRECLPVWTRGARGAGWGPPPCGWGGTPDIHPRDGLCVVPCSASPA